ncbi:MAG TPA: ABC transporter permease [Longimicrobiales bacterium]
MDRLRQDVHFALRSFARRPGFTALVVLTFGLGVGAATAMFSVVDTVLLRPLPYPDADRVVVIHPTYPEWRNGALHHMWDRGRFSLPELTDFAAQQQSFTAFAGYGSTRATLLGAGPPERIEIGVGAPALFTLLGAAPQLGRLFHDGEPGGVILLTDALWRRRFGGDAGVIGRAIVLGGTSYEVVGILRPGFQVAGLAADAWRPLPPPTEGERNDHSYFAIARLRPDVSLDQADAEAARLLTAFATEGHAQHGGRATRMQDDLTRTYRLPLILLVCASFLLLAASCGSVATLLLGAGLDRESEIVVRAALGAARPRILRQLITEGLLLGVGGGVSGLAFTTLLIRVLLQLAPAGTPRLDAVAVDARVLVFAVATSLLCALVFTLLPALAVSDAKLHTPAPAARVTRTAHGRLHTSLVAAEIALATVLLMGAGLLTRTMQQLNAVNPGFDPDGLVTVRLAQDYARLFDPAADDFVSSISTHFARIVDEVSAIPGVHVAVAATLPFSGDAASNDIEPEGYAPAPGEEMTAARRLVSGNYFDVMRMPIITGRGLTPADDRPGGGRVIVVSEQLARRFWPGQPAIGRRIRYWDDEPWTIVGVAADTRERDLRGDGGPARDTDLKFYVPARVRGAGAGSLIVRTNLDLAQLAPLIRERVWAVDPTVAIPEITTMRDRMGQSIAEQRYRMRLVLAFALLAALFAVMGVHGMLSRAAIRRRREMGVRSALGALPRDLGALLIGQAARVTGAGLAVGLALAYFATRVLESFLFETRRADPVTIAAVIGLLLTAAVGAAWQPARRAARVQPMEVLKLE